MSAAMPRGEDHHSATYTVETVVAIRNEPKSASHRSLAEKYPGGSAVAIYKIRAGKTWKHVSPRYGFGYGHDTIS